MRFHSAITATVTRTGRAYNFVGEANQFDSFTSLQDALEWADFIGFTHYQLNGKRRRIPPQYRWAA